MINHDVRRQRKMGMSDRPWVELGERRTRFGGVAECRVLAAADDYIDNVLFGKGCDVRVSCCLSQAGETNLLLAWESSTGLPVVLGRQ